MVKSLDNLFQFVDKKTDDTLEDVRVKAEALITQKKFELKNELTKELATKEDLARLEGRVEVGLGTVRQEMQAGLSTVRQEMQAGLSTMRQEMQAGLGAVRQEILASKEDIARLEGRLEVVRQEMQTIKVELDREIQTVKLVLERKLTVMFIVLLFAMIFFSPNTVDFITKIFNLIK